MSTVEHRFPFPPDVDVLADVRSFALATAEELGVKVSRDDLAVVVGELAANAAVHQDGEALLVITPAPDGGLRVEVSDRDQTALEVVDGPAWDVEGHRGLFLVRALSHAWGVDQIDGGKRVWAELAPLPDGSNANGSNPT